MDKQIDSEMLISAIKKQENIWNKEDKAYHKMSLREASWNKVCEEIIEGWEDITEDNKQVKILEVKKRWNNIRDYYKKALANELSNTTSQGTFKKKRYVFSKKLEFLRPHYGKISSSTHEKQSDDEGSGEYFEVQMLSDSEDLLEESLPTPKKAKTNACDEGTSSTFMPQEDNDNEIDDDSDLLFLKSLVPDMKALSRRQKIDFKLGILQLYKNIIDHSGAIDPFMDEHEDRKFSMH